MIVVDASALINALLKHPGSEAIINRLASSVDSLNAPHILEIEVAHVLRRAALAGKLDAATGVNALTAMREIGVKLFPHGFLIERVWALRHNFSAYDASYVVLAEVLDATLITCDRKLAEAAQRIVPVGLF